MNPIVATGFLVGILAMLFYTPAKFMQGICKLSYGDLTAKEKVMSYIPFYNVIKAEHIYTGRMSSIGIASVAVVIAFIARFGAIFYLTDNRNMQIVTILFVLCALMAWYLCNAITVFMVLHDASLPGYIWRSILFPFGQFYIGSYMNAVIKNMEKEEGTF